MSRQILVENSALRTKSSVDSLIYLNQFISKEFGISKILSPKFAILLDIYKVEQEGALTAVSGVGLSFDIPQATVLRYLDQLTDEGWVTRYDDPADSRRSIIRISPIAKKKLDLVLAA